MTVKFEGWCCTSCLLYLANGDAGDDTDRVAAGIAARWGADELHMVLGDDTAEFSWRPCEACGDTHGGERHAFSILQPAA